MTRPTELPPEYDCPACPRCGSGCTVPARTRDAGRWYGPPEATIVCAACGCGWAGTEAETAQAERAQAAWELLQ